MNKEEREMAYVILLEKVNSKNISNDYREKIYALINKIIKVDLKITCDDGSTFIAEWQTDSYTLYDDEGIHNEGTKLVHPVDIKNFIHENCEDLKVVSIKEINNEEE